MDQISTYQIQKEILKLNENISLWLTESANGTPIELLTIRQNKEYQTLLDRILRNEIAPQLNSRQVGVQKCLQVDYDTPNEVYFIAYEGSGYERTSTPDYSLVNLKGVITVLEKLKIQNRFCHIWTPTSFIPGDKGLIMRFLGLFELFKQQNLLEESFVAPEVKEWLKDGNKARPNFQADIYSHFKLFEPLREATKDPETG